MTQRSTSRGPTLVLLLLAPILAEGVLLACKYVPLARAQGSDDASWNRQFAAGETPTRALTLPGIIWMAGSARTSRSGSR